MKMDKRSIFERDYAGEPVSPYAIVAGNPAKIIKYIEH